MSYKVEKFTIDASFPRYPGSTLLASDRLKLVYNKYKSTVTFPSDSIKINLIFAHGTGMNKSIWKYHIKKLYESAQKNNWNLNSVIAFDAIGHGDSAMLNRGKLGWCYKWEDGSKDLITVLKHEEETTGDFVSDAYNRNIAIGHSLGGYAVIMAGYYEPTLIDAIIPIEAVCYMDETLRPKYVKIFSKMAQLIVDDFDNYKDFETYYKQFSFYKVLHPKVLKDLMEDELYTEVDPKTKETRFKTKASSVSQMSTYLSAVLSLKMGMDALPHLSCGVCHVIATEATWNPPESASIIRNAIPKNLLTAIDISGEHLVIGQFPDETVKVIDSFIRKRIVVALDNKDYYPEVRFNNDRNKILAHQWGLILQGKVEDAIASVPKL